MDVRRQPDLPKRCRSSRRVLFHCFCKHHCSRESQLGMTIVDYLVANAGQVLFLMQQHVEVVLISVGTAAVIGVGLGFWADSRPMLRRALLSVTGTLLTI